MSKSVWFREREKVAGLCEMIEKNSILNLLVLHSYGLTWGNDEKYELFLGDIIRSAKKNCSMWLCDVSISVSGSASFFLINNSPYTPFFFV